LRVREALGLSQRAFAARFGVSLRTLLRIEKGDTEPRGVTKSAFERVLTEGRALIVPNGTQLPISPPQEPPPLEPPSGSELPEIQDAELLLQELGAWMRRTVRRRPESLEQISSGVRRLINEVEGVMGTPGHKEEQNKDSPTETRWGTAGEGG
jgi:transcriptional regulator with XRE-family HTH domain